MKIEEVIHQLEDLIEDRKSFFEEDGGDEIFRADVEALQEAIEIIKESKTQNSSDKEEMRVFETGANTSQKLHEKEKRLLEFIRRLGYGEITIRVQDGLPVMVERVKEKVKL